MQNRAPLLLTPKIVNSSNSKYKFWDTSTAGKQRLPKNLSLIPPIETLQQQDQSIKNIATQPRQPQEISHHSQSVQLQDDSVQDENSNSSNSSGDEKTENQQDKIQVLQQQIEKLRVEFEQGRALNVKVMNQLNRVTNQLKLSQKLNQQLNIESDKLYANMKQCYDKLSVVQNEKMGLIIQLNRVFQEKQIAVNKSELVQQELEYRQKKIQSLYQQISFQKSLSVDIKKQLLVVKQQLNKVLEMMEEYSSLQKEVSKTYSINEEIKKRINILQKQLKKTREEVEQTQINQQKYAEQQNHLFLRVKQLQNENQVLTQKFKMIHSSLFSKQQQNDYLKTKIRESQSRYVKILQQFQQRNQDLGFELRALNERNHKLVDEIDFYKTRVQVTAFNRNQRLPYNQFVTILIAKQEQLHRLKLKLEDAQQEIEKITQIYQTSIANQKQNVKELRFIMQKKQRQAINKAKQMQSQIEMYKKDNSLMTKRNQQLKNLQVKLRLEIADKDKIIINFIEKNQTDRQPYRVISLPQLTTNTNVLQQQKI